MKPSQLPQQEVINRWYYLGSCILGFLIDFISVPVISGFVSAAAITIASSQLRSLLGIVHERPHGVIDTYEKLFTNFNNISLWDTVLGLSCCVILLVAKVSTSYKHIIGRDEMCIDLYLMP